MSYVDAVEKVRDYARKAKTAQEILSAYPDDYCLERIQGYVDGIFKRFCPFKVGDKVRLTVTPEISDTVAHGWLGSKHFLVKGAVATIADIDYQHPKFTFLLVFDNESWVPSTTWGGHGAGVAVSVDPVSRHCYHFREGDIEACPA